MCLCYPLILGVAKEHIRQRLGIGSTYKAKSMLMINSSLEKARWKKIQMMMNFLDQKKKQVRAESRQNIERLW